MAAVDWRIETRHAEQMVLLGCDICRAYLQVSTESPRFLHAVSSFLEDHSACRSVTEPSLGTVIPFQR